MKLNKVWASALALFALMSCNKDIEPSLENISKSEPETKVVDIELGAVQKHDSQEMRAIFGLNQDPNSPDFGKTTGLMMSDKDVVIRVAVRQGNGWPVVQDLPFKKTKNRNHATYKGQITIPTGGTGSYTISGALLHEVGGSVFMTPGKKAETPQANFTKAQVSVRYRSPHGASSGLGNVFIPENTATSIDMPVPYATRWQPLVVEGGVARFVSLDFQPQGTLLRMRVRNDHTESRTFHQIKFVTTAFTLNGDFVMSEGEANDLISWYPWNMETAIFKIPGGMQVNGKVGDQPSYSRWMYRWVMPRRLNFVPKETFASLSLETVLAGAFHLAFQTKQELPNGSVPLTLVYNEGHQASFGDLEDNPTWGTTASVINPLLRVSKGVLNKAGNGFVVNDPVNTADVNVDYRPITEVASIAPITVGGVLYHVPSANELAAIFPREFDRTGYGYTKNSEVGQYTKGVLEHDVQLANFTKSFKADYYVASPTITYGLRLQDQTNHYRTAFKYEFVDRDTSRAALIVYAVLVGGSEKLTIDDIKEDTFWQAREAENKVEKIVFPAYGSKKDNVSTGIIDGIQKQVMLPSKDLYDEGASYILDVDLRVGNTVRPVVGSGSHYRSLPVVLFNNK